MAYKYLLLADETIAGKVAELLFYGVFLPVYLLMVAFWLPMIINYSISSVLEGADALSQKGKMVQCIGGCNPSAGTICDLWLRHSAGFGGWNDVFELRQRIYVRRSACHASESGAL